MYTSGFANPVMDHTANLTEQHKLAAISKGYGISFISQEAKFLEAQRQAALKENPQISLQIK